MESIDAVCYINLEHRKDRKDHILEQLRVVGIPSEKIHRIDAVYCTRNGAKGCAGSHVKLLDLAIEKKWNNVLVLEDDFEFENVNGKQLNEILENFTTAAAGNWDVLMFSGVILNAKRTNISRIAKVDSAQTTSGFWVNRRFFLKLRNLFKICYDKSPDVWEPPLKPNPLAIDQAWKQLQPNAAWYCIHPRIGKQYESYSDIEKRTHSYNA